MNGFLFKVFALEMREREAYRKQTGSNVSVLPYKVSALEHDRFMQVSLYTVSLDSAMYTDDFANT